MYSLKHPEGFLTDYEWENYVLMSETIPAERALPDGLTDREQWLCWRAEDRDGKVTKVPVDPATGSFASTTNPSTWSDFETACERARTETVDGLGFVFTDDDPIVGVDLDECRIPETGKTREWASDIIDRLDSFTEVSPSGTGFHVLVEGSLPGGRNRKGDVELYESNRFFTVTGDHVDGTPETVESRTEALASVYREYLETDSKSDEDESESSPESEPTHANDSSSRLSDEESMSLSDEESTSLSDEALLERAKNASNGEKFTRLYRGRTTGYESNSEADMALCALLAFWTGGNGSQMDRLFRASGLYRDKWDETHYADGSTYGEKTIERAIAGTSEFYEPSGTDSASKARSDEGSKTVSENAAVTDSNEATQTMRPSPTQSVSFEHESEYLERLETLESELQSTLDENDRLRSELEQERSRRKELEAELEAERETDEDDGRWWIPW